ncbi:putative peroxidase [Escherichia coli]|uniref:Putative peroxidase n=1 Tax=Escherichia coli TaxID=562 RepID=A0A376THI1_ECOLX|nr:putative peroxidase [Escherichia coli]
MHKKTQSAPGTLSPDARNEKQPFYGEHQAGILTPQQAAMMLVAFDVLASD